MANVIFKRGTKAQFEAIAEKDNSTLYWLKDVQELWVGNVLFGVGREATTNMAGLLSPEDKAKLDTIVSGACDLMAGDSSIDIDGNEIKVNISAVEGNAVVLKDDGIFVPVAIAPVVPEYLLEKQDVTAEGYTASYRLKRVSGDDISYVGDAINIPKDLMLKGGSMQVVVMDGQPYEGAIVGDPYIDLVLNDAENSHIYIPVNGLVDIYVAGKGIKIEDNVITLDLIPVESNGLFVGENGLGLALATRNTAGALSPVDKIVIDSVPHVYERKAYEVVSTPAGTQVDYRDKEVRVFCPASTEWSKQIVGENGDPNHYYMTFRAYAPSDDVVGFREDIGDVINDSTMYDFVGNGGGIDEYGRKYSRMWLALAMYDDNTGTWKYHGSGSTADHYIGWTYNVEWYNADGVVVASDKIRINLSNESCHHTLEPSYVGALTHTIEDIKDSLAVLEQAATWSDL